MSTADADTAGAGAAAASSASRSPRSSYSCASDRRTVTTCSSGCRSCTGDERVDVGNLYRVLRTLEEQGFVASEWDESVPGPAKRTYEITADGRAALDRWAAALADTRDRIDLYLRRYDERR